jgi:hypothetical protein
MGLSNENNMIHDKVAKAILTKCPITFLFTQVEITHGAFYGYEQCVFLLGLQFVISHHLSILCTYFFQNLRKQRYVAERLPLFICFHLTIIILGTGL